MPFASLLFGVPQLATLQLDVTVACGHPGNSSWTWPPRIFRNGQHRAGTRQLNAACHRLDSKSVALVDGAQDVPM